MYKIYLLFFVKCIEEEVKENELVMRKIFHWIEDAFDCTTERKKCQLNY